MRKFRRNKPLVRNLSKRGVPKSLSFEQKLKLVLSQMARRRKAKTLYVNLSSFEKKLLFDLLKTSPSMFAKVSGKRFSDIS